MVTDLLAAGVVACIPAVARDDAGVEVAEPLDADADDVDADADRSGADASFELRSGHLALGGDADGDDRTRAGRGGRSWAASHGEPAERDRASVSLLQLLDLDLVHGLPPRQSSSAALACAPASDISL